jgi:dihydroxyacetone kinase-like protein
MPDRVGYDEIVKMLHGAAAKIAAEHENLSRLDSVMGDGDHGTTMRRAMGVVLKTINDSGARDLVCTLHDVGWAVLGVDGGATGPLLGTFFIGMSEAAGQRQSLDAKALAEVFEGALAAVRKQTKAQVGDKTMIDALAPAVAALRAAARAGEGVAAAMAKAADAAAAGAASTKDLRAKFGRARNLGDRSMGAPDPGATSMGLMFRGFADALAAAK